MVIKKITPGFVVQTWDTKLQKFTGQEFVAGDQCDCEDEIGNPVDPDLMVDPIDGAEPYLPFDMVQPN